MMHLQLPYLALLAATGTLTRQCEACCLHVCWQEHSAQTSVMRKAGPKTTQIPSTQEAGTHHYKTVEQHGACLQGAERTILDRWRLPLVHLDDVHSHHMRATYVVRYNNDTATDDELQDGKLCLVGGWMALCETRPDRIGSDRTGCSWTEWAGVLNRMP